MIQVAEPKPDAPPPAVTVEVDEHWLGEWVAFGFTEISKSLGHHAEFDQYLETRGGESNVSDP